MADIELVVRIPEKEYKYAIEFGHLDMCGIELAEAVLNGTPLPKGHGDLIDKNEITAFRELECNGHNVESLDEFTTIIEADKESEEQIKVDKEYEEAENAEWGTMEEREYIYDKSSKNWVKKEN